MVRTGGSLVVPVGPLDHTRGPADARITLVEYGDFECPYCRQAHRRLPAVLATGRVRLVFRHFPVGEIHARAEPAAVATEAAARQGRFWEMHDRLFEHADRLGDNDLLQHAHVLALDLDTFRRDIEDHALLRHVRSERADGERSGAHGTPTFFVNGQRCEWAVSQLLNRLVDGSANPAVGPDREGAVHAR